MSATADVRASISARASSSHCLDASKAASSESQTLASPAGPVAIRPVPRLSRRSPASSSSSSSRRASTADPSCSGLTFRSRPDLREGSVGSRLTLFLEGAVVGFSELTTLARSSTPRRAMYSRLRATCASLWRS